MEEFNQGVYDIIIASDEKNGLLAGDEEGAEKEDTEKAQNGDEESNEKRPKKKQKSSKADKEYGVSRGTRIL